VSPVAAVTPPSPGGQPATVASATAASPTDRPTTPTGGWHGPACTQCCWAWSARRSWLGLGGTRHRVMTPVGWPSSSRFSATPPDPRGRCAIDDRRSRDRCEERGNSSRFALRGAQTGRCARRRATITTCPAGWGRRPTRSQRDFVDRSRSAQCAQRGGGRFPLPSAGDAPDRLRLHHRGRRTVASTSERSPLPSVTAGAGWSFRRSRLGPGSSRRRVPQDPVGRSSSL
jgi:hypothetical protein